MKMNSLKLEELREREYGRWYYQNTSILLITVSIFIVIILLMYSGLMYTETMMKQYSACRDKIVGFEQSGIYSSPDQFKLALSYCEVK